MTWARFKGLIPRRQKCLLNSTPGLPAAGPRAPRGDGHGDGAAAAGRRPGAGRVAVGRRKRGELPHPGPEPAHPGVLRVLLGGGRHLRALGQDQNHAEGQMAR